MTSNAITRAQSVPLRRATFVPSTADVVTRRLHVAATAAAVLVSALAVGFVAPLVF